MVGIDYRKDTEAVNPGPAKKDDDDDADELAALMGGLGLTKRCQFCQTEYVFKTCSLSLHPLNNIFYCTFQTAFRKQSADRR